MPSTAPPSSRSASRPSSSAPAAASRSPPPAASSSPSAERTIRMAETTRAGANRPFDAVTLEILWRRTISAVDEAAKAAQAHVVLHPRQRVQRLRLRAHRRRRPVARPEHREHPLLHRHAARDGEGVHQADRPRQHGAGRRARHQHAVDRAPATSTTSPWPSRSSATAASSPSPPPPRMPPTSAARCARWSRARCSRKASTSPS